VLIFALPACQDDDTVTVSCHRHSPLCDVPPSTCSLTNFFIVCINHFSR
jgi:hypothetical protein